MDEILDYSRRGAYAQSLDSILNLVNESGDIVLSDEDRVGISSFLREIICEKSESSVWHQGLISLLYYFLNLLM